MEILVVNDDGIDAEGIGILASALKPYGTVTVVAPDRCRSAVSHALMIYDTIHFERVEKIFCETCYKSSGMPVDCVRLATSVLHKKFDIVFSGVNHGLNVGTDVVYSGTVAAAKEAVIEGIPGVAISSDVHDFEKARREIDEVISYIMNNKLYDSSYVLNVNFSVNQFSHSLGYRFTKQGIKSFKTEFIQNNSGSYDVLSDTITYDTDPDTDVSLGRKGYTTFVPIGVDQTAHHRVADLRKYDKE